MSPEVVDLLRRFDPSAVDRFPPASAAEVRLVEERIQFPLPPSLKSFLSFSNGMNVSFGSLYGVEVSGQATGRSTIESTTERWRNSTVKTLRRKARRGLQADPAIVSTNIAVVAGDQTGDAYVLMGDSRDEAGECPVAVLDHETLAVMGVVASTYERFLWFFIDDISRRAYANGEEKLDEEEILPSDWPFENKAWMLEHDPGLAKWL